MAETALEERVQALDEAVRLGQGRLPAGLLDEAQHLLARAGERSELSGSHTVVAFAGATGSGKSSLFNAVAELDLAKVGVRRPTTATPLACIWGAEGAGELLDWLEVPQRHQLVRESALEPSAQVDLTGLVLLDLPDHDSTQVEHRVEVDRVVALADMLVWVLDPQKYADELVHERYLRRLSGHRDVVVVVLNQVDRLSPQERDHCMRHLRSLLADDGLPDVPVIATSTVSQEGIVELRRRLRAAVKSRQAANARTTADLVAVATRMWTELDGSGPPAAGGGGVLARLRGRSSGASVAPLVEEGDRQRLVDALAVACGVPAVVDAVAHGYVHRSRGATGWPLVRWLGRLRPDPLRRLQVDRQDVPAELLRSSLPVPTPAARSAAAAAVRDLGDAAARRVNGDGGGRGTGGAADGRSTTNGRATTDGRDPGDGGVPDRGVAAGRGEGTEPARRAGDGSAGPHRGDAPRAVVEAVRVVTRRAAERLPDRLDQAVVSTDLESGRVPWWWRLWSVLQWLGVAVLVAGLGWLLLLLAASFTTLDPEVPNLVGIPWPVVLVLAGLLLGIVLAWLSRILTGIGARRAASRADRRLRAAVRMVADEVVLEPVEAELARLAELRGSLARVVR